MRADAFQRSGVAVTHASPPAHGKQSLIRSSAIFSGFTLFSRVFGLVRDLVLTAFGIVIFYLGRATQERSG